MLWLPKLFGKRCIATIHGIDWKRAKWGGFASRYIKFGEWVAVKFADEIIVLDEGKITGVGKHEYLLENNTTYQEIYYSQMDKKEDKK